MTTSATIFDPESEIGFSIGGVGGAHFLADPGELTIDVYKRDRNIHDRQTDLRAILVSPDREVIQEATIPDAGTLHGSGPGPWGHVRLSTQVKRKGVYGLNVTVSRDRYGEEILWGFRTNCPRWLIETARGHNNDHNEEPIVLAGPDRPADVCFLPREGALALEVVDLPQGVKELQMYDGGGTLLEEIPVTGYRDRIRLRAYIPGGRKPLPVLFYIHGGGWVLCSLDTHDSLCRQIANLVPCVVLSVDYHVAPEHKFPEPLEDCWAAFEWARSHAADLGGDPRRIAVGGDSAGGKLSAALTLVARD